MHETSVICDLVVAIQKELEAYNVKSVISVTLVIGKLTNLGKDQMEFAYNVIIRDTVLEGSKLIVEEEEIELRCDSCGYKGPAKKITFNEDDNHTIPILSCPECGGGITVTAGQTCCVKNMDIEEVE